MRFAQNGLYIEQYLKCCNCGVLIYEKNHTHIETAEGLFCSAWCQDWKKARDARRAKKAAKTA